MMRRLTPIIALCVPVAAWGAVVPPPGSTDPHIQSIAYEPDQVVALRVALGYATSIQFGADERIENVVVGNSSAWQVTPNRRGDHLFIKPMQHAAETNLEVITDSRQYSFVLQPAFDLAPDLPFVLRFAYPQAMVSVEQPAAPVAYRFDGDRALRPSRMTDDGNATTVSWPADRPMPAIFSVDESGHEALVNGRAVEGGYRIAGIATRYVFRIAGHEAGARRVPVGARR